MDHKKITLEQAAAYCELTVNELEKDLNCEKMRFYLENNKIFQSDINSWKNGFIHLYALPHIYNFYKS